MSELAEDTSVESKSERAVRDWRIQKLESVGFSAIHAREIAIRHSGPEAIDLHDAIELVLNGCPPHVAADILL